MRTVSDDLSNFEADGFSVLKSAVSSTQIELLSDIVESARTDKTSPGLRNLLRRCPSLKAFANTGVAFDIAQRILGAAPLTVRAILFDKTPASNWYVTWHQDLSIPVKRQVNVEDFGPWSTKDGILHVQPPASVLEKMVSLRIHLDSCDETNGAIKFIPGSHRAGVIEPGCIAGLRDNSVQVIASADRGDIIAMRPLILHSSSAAQNPDRRRVLHLEYAGSKLPYGLEWEEA